MTDALNVAVVGLGYWGPNLVRVLHEVDDFHVASVCDLDESRLARIHKRYPGVSLTANYDGVLNNPEIDAVVLATSVSTHYPLAIKALESGKHVFVEKPLASRADEAGELCRVASERDLTLMPGHTFLYSPPVNYVKELIDSGELGDVYFISSSRVNLGLHQSDVSVVWDLAPHDLSILSYWLGEAPSRVSALSRSCIIPGLPDVAFINLEFESGIVGQMELAWLAPSKLRRTAVVGSRKMVIYDDTGSEPVRVFDSGAHVPDPETFGQYKMTYRTGDILSPRIDVAEPLFLEMTDFAQAIRSGATPRASAELGFDIVRVMESIDASLAEGGTAVDVSGAVTSLG